MGFEPAHGDQISDGVRQEAHLGRARDVPSGGAGMVQKKAEERGYSDVQGGAVSYCQRFGSALNANLHYHSLLLDGVYAFSGEDDPPVFIPAPAPTDEEIKEVTETTAFRVLRLLERRGVIGDDDVMDPLSDEFPILAGMTGASIQGLVATGERAGMRVRRVLSDPAEGVRTSPLCYVSRGFSLHAKRKVEAHDRAGLEKLCSYITRPPLAAGTLQKISDDRLVFKLKSPWSDGTTHLLLSPHELLEKLASIVAPPRANTTRYHGCLAPNSHLRSKVVPTSTGDRKADFGDDDDVRKKPGSSKYRLSWSALLARVFQIDVSVCPACSGKMSIIAFVTDPVSVRRYLKGENLPTDAPAIAQARPPPQEEFDF
jgi:hypothetical protein